MKRKEVVMGSLAHPQRSCLFVSDTREEVEENRNGPASAGNVKSIVAVIVGGGNSATFSESSTDQVHGFNLGEVGGGFCSHDGLE